MSHALVIGAGPAGLMAADVLAAAGHQVTVADQMPSFGRKFLMAGKSGLNLTKAEPLDTFTAHFDNAPNAFRHAIRDFGPDQVQAWAHELGQATFVGSTGRVFPDVMKASPLLRAWLARLNQLGVTFQRRWRWTGWDADGACFDTPDGPVTFPADATVLALGGSSWARLGSDGAWAEHLEGTKPFKPANCGFAVEWTSHMQRHFGTPIKSTKLVAGEHTSRGEWVITQRGIEGGGVYAISGSLRDGAALQVDLMPDVPAAKLLARINGAKGKPSRNGLLKKVLRLSPVKIALFNEWSQGLDIHDAQAVVDAVKVLRVPHKGPLPIDGAISTAGGLAFASLDDDFMLLDRPGTFAAGEMLDWEAPTGGYLITGCLASGRAAGQGALRWLNTVTERSN